MLDYGDSGDKSVAFAHLLEYFSYCPHLRRKKYEDEYFPLIIFHQLGSLGPACHSSLTLPSFLRQCLAHGRPQGLQTAPPVLDPSPPLKLRDTASWQMRHLNSFLLPGCVRMKLKEQPSLVDSSTKTICLPAGLSSPGTPQTRCQR